MSFSITHKAFAFIGCSLLALALALAGRWFHSAAAAIPGAAGDGVVSPSSGAYAAHIDIDIPDYYDLEPDLALVYNSSSDNGFVGMGWDLTGESFIERASPGGGVPKYNSTDIFALDGSELLPCTTFGGTHCPKHQNYERIQQDIANNVWYVWEQDGTKKTYTWLYCVADCSNPTFYQIFRWALKTVQDTNGNTVTYNYWCDPGQNCYLDNITYNGNAIKFWRESRPDDISFANGVRIGHTNYRLKTIEVTVGGSRARVYKLSYGTSGNTERSLLSSVQEYGTDATLDSSGTVTGGTALPAMTMSYSSGDVGFPTQSANGSIGGWNTSWQYLFGDVDDDGKTDQVTLWQHPDGNAYAKVRKSDGSGFSSILSDDSIGGWNPAWKIYLVEVNGDGKIDLVRIWQHASGNAYAQVNLSNGVGFPSQSSNSSVGGWNPTVLTDHFADVNGDGKTDLVRIYKNDNNAYAQVRLSDGKAFSSQTSNGSVGGWNPAWKDYFADVNGDGKADLVRIWQHPDGNAFAQVNLSDGGGFPSQTSNGSVGGWNPAVLTDHFADVNGDGKTDLVRIYKQDNNTNAQVSLSDGRGFAHRSFNGSIGGWNEAWKDHFADVNGDGRPDLVRIWQHPNGNAFAQVNLFDGKGYATQDWNSSIGGWDPARALDNFVDVNGDGKADLVRIWENGNAYAQVNPAAGGSTPPDLLTSMTNGQGGTTTIAYTPSSSWPSKYAPRGGTFPTVAKVIVDDGRSVPGMTSYSYADARFSTVDKAFFGFGYQKAVVDEQGTYVEIYNRQTVHSIGQPDAMYTRNSAGTLYASTTYSYTENGDGAATPYTSQITQSSDFECNLTDACRETRTMFAYDMYGNQTQVIDDGDAALVGDERTKVSGYNYNTASYIVELPQLEQVYSGTTVIEANKVDETRYYYDGAIDPSSPPTQGNLTRTDSWNNQTSDYVWTSGKYDQYGNLTLFTDTRGYTETAIFDPLYHQFPIQSCNALNHCTSREWDYVLGAVTTITDANGAVTQSTYDALGRQISETDPVGNVTTWEFLDVGDPNQQHIRVTLPDGSADGLWTETYTDGLGRAYKVVKEGPRPGVTYLQETVYRDGGNNPQQVSLWYQAGEAPRWESYDYDGAGRLLKTTHADGTVTAITYANDANGKPYTISLDELGHEHAAWADTTERVTQVREKNGAEYYYTKYRYDAVGNLVAVIDHNNNTTTMTYDTLGRKIAMTDMDLGTWRYSYDAGGLLVSHTNAKGQTTTFTYDALERIQSKTAGGQTTTWYYDEPGYGASIGRLTRIVYPEGSESHTWNQLGLETTTTRTVGAVTKTTSATYDVLERLSTLTYPDGETVTYTYTPDGQLASVSGYVNAMTWSPSGQLTQVTYANGTTTAYAYDANRLWLTSANVTKGATTLYTASYTYNAAALVTSETQGTPMPRTVNYTYDDLNRLLAASGAQQQSFTYDAVGNMTSNSLIGAYSYGDPAHKHAVTTAGASAYSYDANGNMLTGDGKSFAWDAENRLTAVTQGSTVTTFAYAAGEQRIKKTQTTVAQASALQPAGQTAQTLYLPIIAAAQNGTTTPPTTGTGQPGHNNAAGTITTLYFGNLVEEVNGSSIQYYYAGPLLVAKKDADGKQSWYHADRLGSIRLMTDSGAAALNRYDYQPFGEQEASVIKVHNERGYTGHIADAETGLTYMVARYYNARLGRFLSADTEVGQPYEPQDLNRYSYVNNNPINNTDPTGHESVFVGWRKIIRWVSVSVTRTIDLTLPYVKFYWTLEIYWKRISVTIHVRIPFTAIYVKKELVTYLPVPRWTLRMERGVKHFKKTIRFSIRVPLINLEPVFKIVKETAKGALGRVRRGVERIDKRGRWLDTSKKNQKQGASFHWWGTRTYLDSSSANRAAGILEWVSKRAGDVGDALGFKEDIQTLKGRKVNVTRPRGGKGGAMAVAGLTAVALERLTDSAAARIRKANRDQHGVVISQPWLFLGSYTVFGARSQ